MGLESFTYDEINSLDYGMYVTQKTVWDAPKRVVSMIQVAGRNGDLTIDEGKYENVRVRYTLKCNATTKDEFAEKVKLFRNELCSRTGYKRLTDTYNQGEYRMGVFITEFSVTGQFNNTAGVFDVEFNCKPQRFLTSGETERSFPEWSDVHSDSGSLVTVDNSSGEYAVKSLSTDIVPQQSGSGDPSPSNVRPITGFDSANIYVSPTTSVGDATTYNISFGSAGTVYGGTLDVVSGQLTVTRIFRQAVASELDSSHWAKGGATNFDEFYMKNTADTYGKTGENYGVENIRCSHAPSLSSASTTQMFTRLANREARIVFPLSMGINSLDAFYAWNQTQIDNNNPLQFCYVLQTPVTYQLTATQVALLLGTNNLWSNTGDIQIEYGKGGNTLYNPTLFDSRPLIELTGAGTLGINNYIITITGSGKLYIDCDTMEAYTITGGIVTSANNRVSLNTTDYPVLRSGINSFAVGTGISNVKITPRWWRI